MKKVSALLIAPALLGLAACSESPPTDSNSADDFAARINGDTSSEAAAGQAAAQSGQQAMATPTVAAPLPNPAPGPYVPGTWTDPESSICGANMMEDFIGKPADEPTRQAIKLAAVGASEVQFVEVSGVTIYPDPTNPRLSIMIDNLGVIRDARCG